MKFVILDVYPSKNHRLIKDTAGVYGAVNNFGSTIFSRIQIDTSIIILECHLLKFS